jgi:hypothetical protein
MKEVTSLLIATSCLALAGLGIYLFSSKSDDNNDNTKFSKGKKINSKKKIYSDSDSDNESETKSDISSDISSDDDSELYKENIKKGKKSQNNKTQKSKNNFSTSRKKKY